MTIRVLLKDNFKIKLASVLKFPIKPVPMRNVFLNKYSSSTLFIRTETKQINLASSNTRTKKKAKLGASAQNNQTKKNFRKNLLQKLHSRQMTQIRFRNAPSSLHVTFPIIRIRIKR